MIDDDKKDVGPFDDSDDDDFGYTPPEGYGDDHQEKDKKPDESKDSSEDDFDDISPNFEDYEDLENDKPAVSVQKKRNTVLMVFIGLVVLYFGYQVAFDKKSDNDRKKKPKNEAEEMSEQFREKASVPGMSRRDLARLPDKKSNSNPLDEITVPPPPPPPPNFDMDNVYSIGGNSGDLVNSGGFDSSMDGNSGGFGGGFSGGGGSGSLGGGSGGSRFGAGRGSGGSRFGSGSSSFGGGSGVPDLGVGGLGEEQVISEEMKKRIQAPMFVGGVSADKGEADAERQGIYPDYEFELEGSDEFRTDSTYVGKLQNVILQGKVMDAVLETAINTDLPGQLRGIVSRDVYAETGRRILIPKGSRLIGTYDTSVTFGKARVYIVWNRVIRPDGVDAVLDEDGMIATDLLGRTGVYGRLDNRFVEIFGSAILLSTIQVAFAVAANEAAGDSQVNSQITDNGDIISSGDLASEAIQESITGLGERFSSILGDAYDIGPRITIDQGTRIKIFVNRDIHFPDETSEEGLVIIK